MYKHILIPTDGSATAAKAVNAGIDYALETGARVTFFTAMPEYKVPSPNQMMAHKAVLTLEDYARDCAEKAAQRLAPALERARGGGVACTADHALDDRPYRAIIAAAKRNRCDAIFMSSHGRKGLGRLLHGSETVDVLSNSDIPMVVLR